jgi:two-component system, OmpR family, phosphate regulon sensor histidine kinase PhoR
MRGLNLGKLLGAWCSLMLSVPIAIIWTRSDIKAGDSSAVYLKMAILLGAVSAMALCITGLVARRWSFQILQFAEFLGSLPAPNTELPIDGTPEMKTLSRSVRALAERVREIVEQARLESSRRDTILACMAEGVLAVDSSLRVIFCNDAFARAFNTRVPAKEGLSLYELVRDTTLRDILGRVLSSGSTEAGRFQLPSAAGRWFEAQALPFASTSSRGAVIVLHDITDVQQQEQLRKDFVADVSHELRTPLTAIRGYAETLLDGALEDTENNRKFVEIILSHAIRLNNIASDLLVLSELDANSGPPVLPERISVREVVNSAINTVVGAARIRDITIDGSACEDCSVLGLRFRLEQVLVNLLDNAVKFNRTGGKVEVACSHISHGKVRVSVEDSGIGIPSGDIKRIFERFYRVDKARSRPVGGTGLGLPIVKEVIDRMGGTVLVESQLGRGSKFTVILEAA